MNDVAEVCALLGKTLCGKKRPLPEFGWRIDTFCDLIDQKSSRNQPPHVALLGDAEGQAALEELQRRDQRLPTADRVFVDQISKSTGGNFSVLGAYLDRLLTKYDGVHLTIVSSDYHIQRIRFVDDHLQPQSLVNELPNVVRVGLEWWSSDFQFHTSNCGTASWFAAAYIAAELLMPLRINVEGLIVGQLNRIVRPVVARFHEGLEKFDSLGSDRQEVDAEFADDVDKVEKWIDRLRADGQRLNQLAGSMSLLGVDENELIGLRDRLGMSIDGIRAISDPDLAKFSRFFDAT